MQSIRRAALFPRARRSPRGGFVVLACLSLATIATGAVSVVPSEPGAGPIAGMAPASIRPPTVVVSFALGSDGNQDRDLQYDPDRPGDAKQLQRFVADSAVRRMANGQHLAVVFRKVTLAGSFEPWRGASLAAVRIVAPSFPPRITLEFRWTDAEGSVIREGERVLTNLDFQRDPRAAPASDPLRYEKALLEGWLERELVAR
jgi:hypothetical protein